MLIYGRKTLSLYLDIMWLQGLLRATFLAAITIVTSLLGTFTPAANPWSWTLTSGRCGTALCSVSSSC